MGYESHIESFTKLFFEYTGHHPESITPLPTSGSARKYYRIKFSEFSCIGTFNNDVKENEAFIYLSEHLAMSHLPVPNIIRVSECKRYYLQNDLGSISLFDIIQDGNTDKLETEKLITNVITDLAKFNALGYKDIDISKLYPVSHFDNQSVMWDLYYFKYCFLKPSGVEFDEIELEKAFHYLADMVLSGDNQFLQYRDFQSRNIMVLSSNHYFIDFQGSRIGPGIYDLASFLYQAKASYTNSFRQKLIHRYFNKLAGYRSIDREKLMLQFNYMAIFRILQTLGAYGYRGLFERKNHFIQSIPLALRNLGDLLLSLADSRLSYIAFLHSKLTQKYRVEDDEPFDGLTVKIYSFSIKKGYPPLNQEHGGGFVFDCRSLPNPGQLDEFKNLTGLNKPVMDYLNSQPEVLHFCEKAFALVNSSIQKYLSRNFKHLSVGFGCTGGQHRSVFCAEQLANHLKESFAEKNILVVVKHIELEEKK